MCPRNPSSPRPLRIAVWFALVLVASCTQTLVRFAAPTQVRQGSRFEMTIETLIASSTVGGSVGCVVQVPNGFAIVDWFAQVTRQAGMPTRNSPALLANYTAETGHHLESFVWTSYLETFPSGGSAVLHLFVDVPTSASGPSGFKVALIGGDPNNLTAIEPLGVTQFAQITAAPYVRSVLVAPNPQADFELVPSFPVVSPGSAAREVLAPTLVDLDGDGDDDVFGSNQAGSSAWDSLSGVAWADRSPGSAAPYVNARSLAFGDFDGNGHQDVVAADGRTCFGSPNGWTAGPVLPVAVGSSAWAVAAGDTDQDGLADVILCDPMGAMRLYLGTGNRTFRGVFNGLPTAAADQAGDRLLLADLTGDGLLDLYAPRNGVQSSPNLWLGTGTGWQTVQGVPSQNRYACAADITGDGIAELLCFGADTTTTPGIAAYRRGPAGSWISTPLFGLPTAHVRDAQPLDVDGDGDPDLAVTTGSLGSGLLQVYENQGGGTFALRPQTGLAEIGSGRVAVGDFSGDGHDDLAVEFHGVRSFQGQGLLGSSTVTSVTRLYRSTRAGAEYVPLAGGCPGSVGYTINVATAAPRLGATTTIVLAPVPSPSWGVLMIGSSNTVSTTLGALPFPLDPFGAPGCAVRVSDDVLQVFAIGSGSLRSSLTIPNAAYLVGVSLYTQGAVRDPVNALGFVLTDAARMRIWN
ncbi:MAG: VCBS repeat-containing protein [Planctomycetota bacterium]